MTNKLSALSLSYDVLKTHHWESNPGLSVKSVYAKSDLKKYFIIAVKKDITSLFLKTIDMDSCIFTKILILRKSFIDRI